jgi:hypothetical protein
VAGYLPSLELDPVLKNGTYTASFDFSLVENPVKKTAQAQTTTSEEIK